MEAVVAVGLAGSVLGIIDVVTRSVQTLQKLQAQYKRADLTASVLIGQLSTLKAALFQISELANMDLVRSSQHRQLVADLTVSLDCCGVLIRVLDDRLQELQRDEHGALRAVGKVKMAWEEKDMVDIRNHLNHQTNALNLLLTASQCRSLFEQVNLLRSDESRRVFNLVKDDTSSLLWLRDAESCYTQKSTFEETLDMIDSTFDFDRELFGSKAYLVATRSNMRHALARKLAPATQEGSPSSRTSIAIINRLDTNNDVETIRRGSVTPRAPFPERRTSNDEHSLGFGNAEDNIIHLTKNERSKPPRPRKQISALRRAVSNISYPTAVESISWSRGMGGLGLGMLGTGSAVSAPTDVSSTNPSLVELQAIRNRLEAL